MATILEIVGQKGEASVADVCAHSDLPKATAYRLVNDLADVGLLDPVARGHFAVGSRLRRIIDDDRTDQHLVETVAPVLRQAADDHGAAFFLSRLRGTSVEIIHVETPDTGVSYLHPGLGRRPLHACSCSKVIAAFSPEVARTINGRLKAYTENTLTSLEDLEAEFVAIRRDGYGECVEELERGIGSIAVPIHDADGSTPTLSIGATGSMRVFTPEFRRSLGVELLALAVELGERLSWADTGAGTDADTGVSAERNEVSA